MLFLQLANSRFKPAGSSTNFFSSALISTFIFSLSARSSRKACSRHRSTRGGFVGPLSLNGRDKLAACSAEFLLSIFERLSDVDR